jgi:hypothetical protein
LRDQVASLTEISSRRVRVKSQETSVMGPRA